jgi:hypothetical protein
VGNTPVKSNTLSLSNLSESSNPVKVSVAYGGKSDSYTINIIDSGNSGGGGSDDDGSGGGGIDIQIHWPWDP